MKDPWLPVGYSDALTYTCTCTCSTTSAPGQVLLFYRYFAAPPSLPAHLLTPSSASDLFAFHTTLTRSLSLGGKIRVGAEGFNVTVGGTSSSIKSYIQACLEHWSFTDLAPDLDSEDARRAFFKPSPGCACVFVGAPASVRVCEEITPMGVTGYVPRDWGVVGELSALEFHEACLGREEEKVVLLDVRNYYESRIGYFVDGEGREAVRPGVRRFGQWPLWVRSGMLEEVGKHEAEKESGKPRQGRGTRYLTYCTGGIRCEKGARFLAENLPRSQPEGRTDSVYTLKGGVQAYLMWMDEEIMAGRKTADESLFKGKNYVFDARGSTGLEHEGEGEKVAQCHVCQKPEDKLSKCRSRGCHLILVVCDKCEEGDVRCCQSCLELDESVATKESKGPRQICACERKREFKLWGHRPVKGVETKSRKAGRRSGLGQRNDINIEIQTID